MVGREGGGGASGGFYSCKYAEVQKQEEEGAKVRKTDAHTAPETVENNEAPGDGAPKGMLDSLLVEHNDKEGFKSVLRRSTMAPWLCRSTLPFFRAIAIQRRQQSEFDSEALSRLLARQRVAHPSFCRTHTAATHYTQATGGHGGTSRGLTIT